jgi:hypothetical protein
MKKLYPDEDINDIIESEEKAFFKGGPGSGIKGHRTPKKEPVGNAWHQYAVVRQKFENAIKEGKIRRAQNMLPELRRLKAAAIAEKKSKS